MNETELLQELKSAYHVAAVEDAQMDAMARTIRLGSNRSRSRKRILAGLALLAGLGVAVGFTYPSTQAMLFGLNVKRNIDAAGPYLVRVSFNEPIHSGETVRKDPCEILIDGTDQFMPGLVPGSKTFEYVDTLHQFHVVHPASKVEVIVPPDPHADDFFKLPLIVMEQLGAFDLKKRMENRGIKLIKGRRVEEVAYREDGRVQLALEIDPDRGVPLSMTLAAKDGHSKSIMSPFPFDMRYEYVFDADSVRRRIASLKPYLSGLRQLGLKRDSATVRKDELSKPLCVTRTGRDVIKLYQVQQNQEGDVFLLYSCRGAHQDEQMPGNFLELKDDSGRQWLTKTISMTFNELGVKGEDIKAQVFFHPEKPTQIANAHISMRIDGGDYLRFEEPSTRTTRVLSLGKFPTSKVNWVPIWYFYNSANQDEVCLKMSGQELRFKYALENKDFQKAIQLGRAFDDAYPDMIESMFFGRPELYRDLAKAYRGIGDVQTAKRYESAAAEPVPSIVHP